MPPVGFGRNRPHSTNDPTSLRESRTNSGDDLASTGEGADTVSDVEIIDESFTLSATLLSGLDV
jgi:hypothetical protein